MRCPKGAFLTRGLGDELAFLSSDEESQLVDVPGTSQQYDHST